MTTFMIVIVTVYIYINNIYINYINNTFHYNNMKYMKPFNVILYIYTFTIFFSKNIYI